MDGFGKLRDKLDQKILILFILRRLPDYVDADTLAELALTDGSVGYFEYAGILSELVEAENVTQTAEGYRITEKGDQSCEVVESSLPYTVRMHLEKALKPLADKMRRRSMIKADHSIGLNGSCMVHLAMSDGISNIIDMRLLTSGEEQAVKIENRFREEAELYYNRIMEMLIGNE